MFFLILIPVVLIFVLLWMYIYSWLKRLLRMPDNRRNKAIAVIGSVALCVASLNLFSTAGIVLLHFWFFSAVTDGILKLPIPGKKRLHYMVPLMITAALMIYGSWNVGQVHRTDYTVDTGRLSKPMRILLITDVHYDTIQKPEVLESKLAEMNNVNPDLIVLGGDIVEEGTSRERMYQVFDRLGQLKSTYGTYFVYGNHDRQLYSAAPKYTQEELRAAITDNGIRILQDEVAALNDEVLLAGREDASSAGMTAAELIPTDDRLVILADHQPTRAKENAAAGADIQLSGHTHAGQVWPVGLFLELVGLNYGQYRVGESDVFVSSGFAGWGFTVRTSEVCEYAVIDLR